MNKLSFLSIIIFKTNFETATNLSFVNFYYFYCLQTVLESVSLGNTSSSDEELEQWEQIFMMRDENGNSYNDK